MIILGIESSCDETSAAVIERGKRNRIIKEITKSQIPLHSKYGGVVPEIASRNHYRVIDHITQQAINQAELTIKDIDLIALTVGPGLIGSLLVGLSFAKALSFSRKIPLVGVDHLYAHIESAFIDSANINYPILALVVSGGHTSLFYQISKFETKLISKTRDDAVGEVMDKVAKYFNLGYPGGPIIEKIYPEGNKTKFAFTIPKMSDGSDDFSFSGYKTAILRYSKKLSIRANSQIFKDLISSFLSSIVNYLLMKTRIIADRLEVNSIIIAGGVSRNSLLRKRFQREFANSAIRLYLPSLKYCTDNAAMIAWLGYEKYTNFPQANYFDFELNSYSRASFKTNSRHR